MAISPMRKAGAAFLALVAAGALASCSAKGCPEGAASPEQAVQGLLTSAKAGDSAQAARYLTQGFSVDSAAFAKVRSALQSQEIASLGIAPEQMGTDWILTVSTPSGSQVGEFYVTRADETCYSVAWGADGRQDLNGEGGSSTER